jgi:dipeptidyl aminopeptidase/acylaminoacyl peptidase
LYPDEEHGFIGDEAMIDLSLKVNAFFAHYLKGMRAEKWMFAD